jgi:4'-phosphopantetheinyl transferase
MTQIDLYWIAIEQWVPQFAALEALLSAEERDRAARFHAHEDCVRFVVAHGWLRRILSGHTGTPPERLAVLTGDHGKPFIAGACQFNLSYGKGAALIATADFPVGVDVEALHEVRDAAAIAQKFFAPEEAAAVAACETSTRSNVFLTLWTRHEAFVKAVGYGLGKDRGYFGAGLQSAIAHDADNKKWTLVTLTCFAGHIAALCAPGNWTWREQVLPPLQA